MISIRAKERGGYDEMPLPYRATAAVIFLGLGFVIFKNPFVVTLTGLLLYLASLAAGAMIDVSMLLSGLIIKVLIIVGLVKAVRAAREYEAEPTEDPEPEAAA